MCLYNFVANYDSYGTDKDGHHKHIKLTKPRLPNHKLYDPSKEEQREDYYYSLILLFVPFQDESSLLLGLVLRTTQNCSQSFKQRQMSEQLMACNNHSTGWMTIHR